MFISAFCVLIYFIVDSINQGNSSHWHAARKSKNSLAMCCHLVKLQPTKF